MTKSKIPDDLEIAPGYKVSDWKTLVLDPNNPNAEDWQKAIKIFRARIQHRFLDAVDVLIEHPCSTQKGFGFAILAIDFLVIETLQGFREGVIDHSNKSRSLITNFLTQWEAFMACLPQGSDPGMLAKLVYENYRCALHHSGSTDGAFRIRAVGGKMFTFKNNHEVELNRTALHKNLKTEFDAYVEKLRELQCTGLRSNLKKKMDDICGL